MTSKQQPAPEQPAHKEVASVIRALLRTERTFRTFTPEDPICARALGVLEPRLKALLPLDLEVRPDQLLWQRRTLLDPNEPSDLPARLHRDGIRRLVLGQDLKLEELTRFLEAAARRLDRDELQHDYVTIFWDADLPNLSVISIDPNLDLDVPDDVLDGGLAGQDDTASTDQPEIPAPPEDAFRITAEDRQAIAQELASAEAQPSWDSFIEALLENLVRPLRRERIEQITVLLEETFERLLIERRFDHAAKVLAGMRGALPAGAVFTVRQTLERLAHPERLQLIVSALEAGTCTEDQAEKLFLGFDEWAAESLCALLARARGEHLRRLYVDMLVKTGPAALEPVMVHLLHSEPSARSYFARALGRLKDDGAKEALVSCLSSDDATLRGEAILGLTVHADDEIRARLWEIALSDPDAGVRTTALKSVIEDRANVDSARVIQRLESTDLNALGEEEKDLLFKALGAGGGDEALDYLSRSLRGRWMPGRSELEGWRRSALALVSMGSPAALDLLKTHAQGRGKLASVCQDALRHASMGKA